MADSYDPFLDYICQLSYEGSDGSKRGQGVLAELQVPDDTSWIELPGLRKCKAALTESKQKKELTNYVLLTAHHVIPGFSYTGGWSVVYSALQSKRTKPLPLKSVVVAAVSCCGADSVVVSHHSACNKSRLLRAHPNERCELKLDFTVFFLSDTKCVLSAKDLSLPQLSLDAMENFLYLKNIMMSPSDRICLYLRNHLATDHEGVTCLLGFVPSSCKYRFPDREQKNALAVQPTDLLMDVVQRERFQNLYYHVNSNDDSTKLKEGFSGAPIVHHPSAGVSFKPQLLGIHIGVTISDPSEAYAVSSCAIVHLMRGDIAACLAFMRHPQPRRLKPSCWTGVFQAHFGPHNSTPPSLRDCTSSTAKQSLSPKNLLRLLYLLLVEEKHENKLIRDVRGDVAALKLLSSVFLQLKYSNVKELSIVTHGALPTEEALEEFIARIKTLYKELPSYLGSIESDRDLEMEHSGVVACFWCWYCALKFNYRNTAYDVLFSEVNHEKLRRLKNKYRQYKEISDLYGDIVDEKDSFQTLQNRRLMQEAKTAGEAIRKLQEKVEEAEKREWLQEELQKAEERERLLQEKLLQHKKTLGKLNLEVEDIWRKLHTQQRQLQHSYARTLSNDSFLNQEEAKDRLVNKCIRVLPKKLSTTQRLPPAMPYSTSCEPQYDSVHSSEDVESTGKPSLTEYGEVARELMTVQSGIQAVKAELDSELINLTAAQI